MLDEELRAAFALHDQLSNYEWINEEEEEEPFKAIKRGVMIVPLNKETFEEMQAATLFTEEWSTKTKLIMKKKRLFRINLYMHAVGVKKPQRATAQMKDRDTVHVLWRAIDEMSMFIMTQDKNKDVEWDIDKCKAVIKV